MTDFPVSKSATFADLRMSSQTRQWRERNQCGDNKLVVGGCLTSPESLEQSARSTGLSDGQTAETQGLIANECIILDTPLVNAHLLTA